jgi:putative ABC transport system permease protein
VALAGLEAPLHQSMFIANAVWIIVVLVAAVALLNTLTLSVLERRREIGVLRAMGSSRRLALQMVLAEAAGIGVIGGVLGLVFGLTDQWLYSLVSGDVMNFDVRFQPSPMAIVFTVGAVALSLLGSMSPARRAARLNIIEAVSVE